jgi:chromatin assembly factor 1 subunit A
MSYTRIKNIYKNLEIDELGDPTTTQIGRKAIKKLREIEALKTKINPTAEEWKKIATERYWMNILHPEENKPDNKPTAKELKKQADKEKRQKREEEKNNQKVLRAEQEIQEGMKREQARLKSEEEARKARLKSEEEARKARLKFEEEARKARDQYESQREVEKVLKPFHENPLAVLIYKEYMAISRKDNHKMAFRKLSMKYHPDKNPTENTTLHQQILHHIYENMAKK